MNLQRQRWIEGAKRYALANPSDPFALDRAMCHIRTGIVGLVSRGNEVVEALYDATPATEMRKSSSGEYPVTVYRNVVRP